MEKPVIRKKMSKSELYKAAMEQAELIDRMEMLLKAAVAHNIENDNKRWGLDVSLESARMFLNYTVATLLKANEVDALIIDANELKEMYKKHQVSFNGNVEDLKTITLSLKPLAVLDHE